MIELDDENDVCEMEEGSVTEHERVRLRGIGCAE